MAVEPLLVVENLVKDFEVGAPWGGGRRTLRAVDGVSLTVDAGETVGIVGESGCGKTTLARLLLRLAEPTAGSVRFDGRDITHATTAELRALRRQLQVVFQDPYSSLNPRMKVRDIVAEPLENAGVAPAAATARVAEVLATVGLPAEVMDRHPHAFSGGQRQRIGLARALAPRPRLVVCDEAVSALDVSIQAQVLNLLRDVQDALGLAIVFISHNLAVVRHVSHRIVVMYLGQVMELAPEPALFSRPRHPYTRALIESVPEPDPRARGRRRVLAGDIPSPIAPPPGCVFHPRCPRAEARCRAERPQPRVVGEATVRCHFPL
ncbi:MAG: ATP-binding cassette domain-containing protein [Ectothiorhodospiraceae bacterium]|nr:ATP-binding cassette domain-containing protein [Chromatiales bacterium]MCP5154362.1 ATP-binding cassette domain-containing protein [Ectothiorhodospiraceae bacterium]